MARVRPEATAADAALARRLMAAADAAALAVIQPSGAPYTALTTPALAPDGAPLVLASDLSAHGEALAADGRASLLFWDAIDPAEPLRAARLTVAGRAGPATPEDRSAYLARRPAAHAYIDFGDMRLYRIGLESAHLVAGFGRAVALPTAMLLTGDGARDIGPQSRGK